MGSIRFVFGLAGSAVLALALSAAGCSSKSNDVNGFDGGSASGGSSGGGDDDASLGDDGGSAPSLGPVNDAAHGCVNLQCNVASCGAGATTTVSGVVYDPAGKTPLYNVIVYVPNAPVDAFKPGPSCDQCGVVSSGDPITSALTDESGKFTLQNVPSGKDIPLVIQVGKWRRQVKIPNVASCTETKLADPDLTRLPKNHAEGDMPQMALTTGGYDALECLFLRMGIDQSEFTSSAHGGRIHVYTGEGGATIDGSTSATPFWSNVNNLMKYDIVLLSCEGDTYSADKPAAALKAMHDYANAGGRVFGTHYQYYWLQSGPADFQGTASWTPDGSSGGATTTFSIDTSFPKGKSFAQWLLNVGASTTLGQIDLTVQVNGDVAAINKQEAQEYIYVPSPDESAKYMTFNTPIGVPVAQQCGRVVYSDVHVTGSGGESFPADCGTQPLSEAEKALEFLFFDLSSCIQDPSQPPPPPPVK